MRRRTVIAQLLIFAVIAVLIIGYTASRLLGIKVTDRPFPVTVHLATGGGIFDGAQVTYRGVGVGRVDGVRLGTDGVTVRLAIDHGTKIPADAVAHVYDLSPVGEQYLDLVPKGRSGDYLRAGSVIPAERTTTPPQIASVLYDVQRFIAGLNPRDLQLLAAEGAAAFGGTGPQLRAILAGSTQLVDQLSRTQQAANRLIGDANILLHGAAAHADELTAFARSLRALSATLAGVTPTTEKLIRQGVPTTRLIDGLLRENAPALGVLLGNLATLSGIQVARVPGLQALLVAVPQFGRLAPQMVDGDALRGVLNFNASQPLCPSGVPLSNPLSGTRSPLYSVGCSGLPRGASNAPRPAGTQPASFGSARLTEARTAQVGGYDPGDGLVSTADGSMVRLGMSGGQADALGPASWQALLLAVTGS